MRVGGGITCIRRSANGLGRSFPSTRTPAQPSQFVHRPLPMYLSPSVSVLFHPFFSTLQAQSPSPTLDTTILTLQASKTRETYRIMPEFWQVPLKGGKKKKKIQRSFASVPVSNFRQIKKIPEFSDRVVSGPCLAIIRYHAKVSCHFVTATTVKDLAWHFFHVPLFLFAMIFSFYEDTSSGRDGPLRPPREHGLA